MLAFWQGLVNAFSFSRLAGSASKISLRTVELFSGSRLWSFVKRKDFFSMAWEHSLLFTLLNKGLEALSAILRKPYLRVEAVLQESAAFRILRIAILKYEFLVAFGLVIAMIIPHKYWYNDYGAVLAVLLVFLYLLRTVLLKHERFNLKGLDFMLAIFALSVILAEVTSLMPRESLTTFIFYCICFLFVLVIVSGINTAKGLNTLLSIMAAGVTIGALYGGWQAILGVPFDITLTDLSLNEGMPGRIFSTMGNPNNYAEFLVLTIPFFFALILNSKTVKAKIIYVIMLAPPLVALLMTGARSSWVAFAVAVMVFVFFKDMRLIPLIAVVGILFIPVLPDWALRRVTTIWNPNDSSFKYRLTIYENFWPVLKEFWFTGLGLGSAPFVRILQKYFEYTPLEGTLFYLGPTNKISDISKYMSFPFIPPHSHNLYLQIWIETGVIGFLSFIWFIGRTIKKCMINIFSKADEQLNHILMAGISAIAGISVIGLAEYVWFYPRLMLFFWVDIGILLAGLSIIAKKSGGPDKRKL